MITQFDHLTLYTKDLDAHRALLESLGYKMRFEATPVNPMIKRELVTEFSKTHRLALFDLPGSLSIELIEELQPSGSASCIVPIFSNAPERLIESHREVRIGRETRIEATLRGLDAPVFVTLPTGRGFSFAAFVLKVSDLEKNRGVWRALGWSIPKGIKESRQLVFHSPLHPFPAMIYIVEDSTIKTPVALDAEGFNYVALVSTNPKKERERIMSEGYEVTALEKHMVNGKDLDLFFVTGKNVQPIEVLGLHS